ncbi:MAG: uroporphyrinogen-III C-methyltransferase [Methylococcaceae bacterium]
MAELTEKQEQALDEGKKSQRSRNGFWFGIIVLLIVLILAGAGFYLFSQLRQAQDNLGGEVNKGDLQVIELSKQISGYQTQLSSIQAQLASLESSMAGKDNHFTKTLADFSQLHTEKLEVIRKELAGSIEHIQRQLGKTRGDWLVADAEYLLSTANERLHLIGDVNTAREALLAADQRLRESGDAAAFKVREQITKDLAVLNNVATVDIVGTYAMLQSLQDNADKLALYLPYAGKNVVVEKPTAKNNDANKESQDSVGEGLLDSALEQLEGMVTIRHTDQPIKAILTEEEAQFIREQLRLRLEMVKIALIQQNDRLFQASISDVKKWTETNFAKNNEVGVFVQEINKLASLKLHQQFPDLSDSLKMLRDITKLRIETDKATEAIQPAVVEQPAEKAVAPVEAQPPAN